MPRGDLKACADCDVHPWKLWDDQLGSFAHEDFYVRDELWDAVCPDDLVEQGRYPDGFVWRNGTYLLCIGCFERRLGRQLQPADFKPDADPDGHYWRELVGRPSSSRFRDRLGRRSVA